MVAPFDPAHIEAVARLMRDYELDEYASEHFSLKKSKHKPSMAKVSPADAALAKHLEPPVVDEPWLAIPQGEADQWAQGKS